MKRHIFLFLVFILQFSSMEASWSNKTLNDLKTAITWSNTYAIRQIIKHHPEYLNYADSVSYNTPLIRAVAYRHYAAAKQLLELGADPNIHSLTGYTPLMAAIEEHPRRDFIYKDTKYIRLLAKYGVNLNDTCKYIPGELIIKGNGAYGNMLMLTLKHHIEKLKCLVELGADIEQACLDGETVAIHALLVDYDLKMAHYLIVEKKADITRSYYWYKSPVSREIDYSEKHYAVEMLLNMVYQLDSEEYRRKMEIVEEFKRQGVDYQSWKDRVPEKTMKRIKILYKEAWKDYFEKY